MFTTTASRSGRLRLQTGASTLNWIQRMGTHGLVNSPFHFVDETYLYVQSGVGANRVQYLIPTGDNECSLGRSLGFRWSDVVSVNVHAEDTIYAGNYASTSPFVIKTPNSLAVQTTRLIIGGDTDLVVAQWQVSVSSMDMLNGNVTIRNTDDNPRSLNLYEPSSNGLNYVGFKARAMAANTLYVLPDAFPSTDGSMWTGDSFGNINWTAVLPVANGGTGSSGGVTSIIHRDFGGI